MKIKFLFNKGTFQLAIGGLQAIRGCVDKYLSSHSMGSSAMPVRTGGMYGLLVMSDHEQNARR